MEKFDDNNGFKPYIVTNRKIPEFTIKAVILGIFLGILFGAANAYLGLKVGITVSASIPVAVISMGILRGILRRGTILENNLVQTIGSAGESLAAGVIFTVPALFILGYHPTLFKIFIWATIGGFLGVLFMIPLRHYLIVREHKKLPYPEGTACAEILIAGEEGGSKALTVFLGLGVGAIYKFLMSGLGLWAETPKFQISKPKIGMGIDAIPALLGVGYIIGPRISAFILGGGALAWLVFIPLIAQFGESIPGLITPESVALAELSAIEIWDKYIRYIGAGGVAVGGVISLIRAIPTIISSLRGSYKKMVRDVYGKAVQNTINRTDREIPMKTILISLGVLIIAIALLPQIKVGIIGSIFIIIFSFFFVTVSSRIVGLVGSSSNPASGMTIATLLFTTVIFALMGQTGPSGEVAALSVGAIVCMAICVAGDTSQDLKTGYLVGATPLYQQIGELIGVLSSALFIGLSVYLLNAAYGIGPGGQLQAPQATLMAMVIEGVMNANLPWILVAIGGVTAIIVELLGVSSLPFAVGLYLPIYLSTPIMCGGIVKWIVDRKKGAKSTFKDLGILYASGLIAGEAGIGIVLAFFAWLGLSFAFFTKIFPVFTSIISLFIFAILAVSLYLVGRKKIS